MRFLVCERLVLRAGGFFERLLIAFGLESLGSRRCVQLRLEDWTTALQHYSTTACLALLVSAKLLSRLMSVFDRILYVAIPE